MQLFRRQQQNNRRPVLSKALQVESLESRQLMDAYIGLIAGDLIVHGTEYDDVVTVKFVPGADSATDSIVVEQGHYDWKGNFTIDATKSVSASGFGGKLKFSGKHGDDKFFNDTWIASEAHGGSGNDLLVGGSAADLLDGGTGSDRLDGGGGNDILKGGAGEDELFGHAGDDELDGGAGKDYLVGGAGNDTLEGKQAADMLFGGGGLDVLHGGEGDDELWGANVNELASSIVDAQGDWMDGGAGDDLLIAGPGHDQLFGGDGSDYLFGGAGNDELQGQAGDDMLQGNAGDDLLVGGDNEDFLDGGAGDDQLVAYLWDANQYAWGAFFGYGWMAAESGSGNYLEGGSGNDILYGGWHSDYLGGSAGKDSLFGMAGNDILLGGTGDDLLLGGGGNDLLAGQNGDDVLRGGSGDDHLDGGSGQLDKLFGDEGQDQLVDPHARALVGGSGWDLVNGVYDPLPELLLSRSGQERALAGVDSRVHAALFARCSCFRPL